MSLMGNIIIGIGIVFIGFGVLGLFRFKDFYSRILIASKVDTVGFITIMAGIIISKGINFFSLKILLILLITFIINPFITQTIAHSAFISGYKIKKENN